LPHRAKMLEALSTIDTSLPDSNSGPPLTEPSVIIHCGQSQQIRGQKMCMVLGAAQMEQFVRELHGSNINEILTRRTAPVNRRDELMMNDKAKTHSETEIHS